MTAILPTSFESTARRVPEALPVSAAEGPHRKLPLPEHIQFSYNTRFVHRKVEADRSRYHLVAGADVVPHPGDVVIARVKNIRNHKRVETENSRRAILFPDHIIALAYGNRYAADQFLAHVPDSLIPCHLVAAGGVAGVVTQVHRNISGPTTIEPIGLLSDEAGIINLQTAAPYTNVPTTTELTARPKVIAVLGTSMNSGKSTVMSHLINGLTNAGLKVGAGKITGTGAGNDVSQYYDGGASQSIDFTDFGYATTFQMDFEQIRSLTMNMVGVLSTDNDIVVVEIADGVYQAETSRLLRDPLFHSVVDGVAFAAVDSLGATAGIHELHSAGLNVLFASGVLTSSPLATQEATDALASVNVPVVGTFDLMDAAIARSVAAIAQ